MERIRRLVVSSWFRAVFSCIAVAVAVAWVWRWRVVEYATVRNPLVTADLFVYFFPMLEVGYRHLRAGELFFWNPNQMSGMPGLATLQAGFLYPLHLVYLVLPTATGMAVMAVVHTLLAGWGMLLLARLRNLRWLPAVVAACYFSLTTVLPWFYWPPGMEAAAWLPLGIAAIEGLDAKRDRRWFPVLVAAVVMPLLAGGYQTTVAIYYVYGLWIVAGLARRFVLERQGLIPLLWHVAPAAAGGTVGLLLAAPQMLPTLELAGFAERSTSTLAQVRMWMWGLNPWASSRELWAGLLVSPSVFVALQTFVGVAALALSILGALRLGTRSLVLGSLLVFGILSLWAPDWFLAFRLSLPVLGWFRAPAREFFVAKFAVSLLLAHGLDPLLDPRRINRVPVIRSALAGMLMTALLFEAGRSDGTLPFLTIGTLGVFVASILVRSRGPRRVVFAGALTLLAYDTLARPVNDLALPYVDERWREIYDSERVYQIVSSLDGYNRSLVVGSVQVVKGAMLFGTFSPVDYDPLVIASFHDCLRLAKDERSAGHTANAEPLFAGFPANMQQLLTLPSRRCLDLSAVTLAVVPRVTLMDAGVSAGWNSTGTLMPIPDSQDDNPAFAPVLIQNRNAVRRTYGVYSAECGSSQRAELKRALEPSFDLHATVVLEAGADCAETTVPSKGLSPAKASIARLGDTEIEIRSEFGAPGFVVLTDSFYPGWVASVDGSPVDVQRANGMYRAVRVPAGNSTVVFRFRPYSFYVGCGVLLVGLLLGGIIWRWMGPSGSSRRVSPDDHDAFAKPMPE